MKWKIILSNDYINSHIRYIKFNSITLNGNNRKLILKALNLNEKREWIIAMKGMIDYANTKSCPYENYILTDKKPWKVILKLIAVISYHI